MEKGAEMDQQFVITTLIMCLNICSLVLIYILVIRLIKKISGKNNTLKKENDTNKDLL